MQRTAQSRPDIPRAADAISGSAECFSIHALHSYNRAQSQGKNTAVRGESLKNQRHQNRGKSKPLCPFTNPACVLHPAKSRITYPKVPAVLLQPILHTYTTQKKQVCQAKSMPHLLFPSFFYTNTFSASFLGAIAEAKGQQIFSSSAKGLHDLQKLRLADNVYWQKKR